ERRVDPVVRRALISRTIHPFEALISTAWSGNRCGRRWRATRSSSSNRSRILHATSGHAVPRPDLGPPMRGHPPERTSAYKPLEPARTELKLAPGFLVRSAPKPRRVVDRVGA